MSRKEAQLRPAKSEALRELGGQEGAGGGGSRAGRNETRTTDGQPKWNLARPHFLQTVFKHVLLSRLQTMAVGDGGGRGVLPAS